MHSSHRVRRTYTKLLAIVGVIVGTILFSLSAHADVLKIVINDTIQPISAEYITRAIDEARRRNDQAILIEINTPGGLLSSTSEIMEKITASFSRP